MYVGQKREMGSIELFYIKDYGTFQIGLGEAFKIDGTIYTPVRHLSSEPFEADTDEDSLILLPDFKESELRQSTKFCYL